MDFSQSMTDFSCIFSFLVILISIVYDVFQHHSQMDFSSQNMTDFCCIFSFLVISIVYSIFQHHSQMDFWQSVTDFCCIFSFLVILILIVYGFFYHDIQMDFSQIVNDFTCSVLIVFTFFYIPQWMYSLICFGVFFFMLTPMDIFLYFVNWRMTFTSAIACLFKTSRMSFTATSMFFCGDGHRDKDSKDSNEDSEEDSDKDSDEDSEED